MIGLIAAFLLAMGVTWLTTPLALKLATRFNVMAVPRMRDVHRKTTPRLGGMAIYLGVILAVVITISYRHVITHGANGWNQRFLGVLIAGTFIAILGIIDDVKDLRAIWQALGILACGGILIAFGVRIEGIAHPLLAQQAGVNTGDNWFALSMPISIISTLFWVFLVTKTVDAVDGLDGLAAGVCAIAAATLALLAAASNQPEGPSIALFAAAVTGACIGFLRYNFNPARIFMSTIGSQFLGFTLAALSIMGTFKWAAAISVAVPILVLGVPIFDYFIVLTRRLLNRAPLTKADRRHFHHRLMDRGLSQKQAVYVIYCCTGILCIAALFIYKYSRW